MLHKGAEITELREECSLNDYVVKVLYVSMHLNWIMTHGSVLCSKKRKPVCHTVGILTGRKKT